MMEIDANELDRYLASAPAAFSMNSTLGGQVVGADEGMNGSTEVVNHGVDPNDTDDMSGAVGMDEIVAENVRELRRRSLANGYGIEYLNVTDPSTDLTNTLSQMGSPTSYNPSQAPNGMSQMGQIPSSMSPYSNMNQTAADMGMIMSTISESEMQPAMNIYAGSQVMPNSSHNSPVHNSLGGSVPQSPVGPPPPGAIAQSPHLRMQNGSMTPGPMTQMHMSQMPVSMDHNGMDSMSAITGGQYSPMDVKPQPSMFAENTYSSSGFDMMGILHRVANRKNPQINIGAVDMSCSFVVTDARKFDNPIVYCSATFERLTGYTKHEVLGRNCRFLQAPDGKIVAGVKRKYVDDNAVYYLKNQVQAKKEAQTSLINYRKGGQAFTNLLTMIPIMWDDNMYFVGFQVDLVDQPGAMFNKNQGLDGSFAINYQYSQLPQYIPASTTGLCMDHGRGLTVARDDVTQVLSSFGTGDSEFHSKRILDKVLLENTDDVVHVLSLKGLFLYCSPSIRKVLEYEPQELVGTSLSGVCHPSDIVPVTRDLKDTSAGSSVNVVFRIRRKYSGYMWFESHGCLHTEQGKGRKCIILVGRERPVYYLSMREVLASGGMGDNELWTKMSTSGMFLFVSSNSKLLLDREPEEMTGTSVQALMRPDSKNEIGRALENARNGVKSTARHEIQNKRGQFLQALTTLFPGDGSEGKRPTFLVCQTRLLKHTRTSASSPTHTIKSVHSIDAASSAPSTPSVWSTSSPNHSTQFTSSGDGSASAGSRENSADSGCLDDNLFEELKATRSTSWQFELRQMQRTNKRLVEELSSLLAMRKKRKRRKGADQLEKDCANCHTRVTPEWRRGPSGKRDLCNSCGLRYAKLIGRVSPRTGTSTSDKGNTSPGHSSVATSQSLAAESALNNVAKSTGLTPISPANPVVPQQGSPSHHSQAQSQPVQIPTQINGSHPMSPLGNTPHSLPLSPAQQMRRGSINGNGMMSSQQSHPVMSSSNGGRMEATNGGG
ncbi:hypothetical protein RUND412_008622 [Rhizina undulata]